MKFRELNEDDKYLTENLDKAINYYNFSVLEYLNKKHPLYEDAAVYIVKSTTMPIEEMDLNMRRNKNIMSAYLEYDNNTSKIGENLKHDKELMLKAVKLNGDRNVALNAANKLLNDRDFVLEVLTVGEHGVFLEHLRSDFQKDIELLSLSIKTMTKKQFPRVVGMLKNAGIDLNTYSKDLMKCVEKNTLLFDILPDEIKYNKDVLYELEEAIMYSLKTPVDVFEAFKAFKREDMLNTELKDFNNANPHTKNKIKI